MNTTFPRTCKQAFITKKTSNLREAIEIKTVNLSNPTGKNVLIKTKFAGVQASEEMISSGVYGPLKSHDPPVPAGIESVGEIVAIGDRVSNLKVGQAVLFGKCGFSEYATLLEDEVFPIPSASAEYVAVLLSAATAYMAFYNNGLHLMQQKPSNQQEVGNKQASNKTQDTKRTFLVTAASGGTGMFAVQFAKLLGFHVIGTCSSDEKAEHLKQYCDRVIQVKREDLDSVLSKEYPRGIDYIYESVGKQVFETCMKNLAVQGTMILIGFISAYKDLKQNKNNEQYKYHPFVDMNNVLFKEQIIHGFFLGMSMERDKEEYKKGVQWISKQIEEKKVHVMLEKKEFKGLEAVHEAFEYLHSGKNVGKVYLTM